ncbi:hypothetical protein OV208_04195 [Corallococcus sp. bb12-1]|uniref:hypothetical protein n=1 Tax=Corallococcus sp. bb12-1 TaxID=2996784 RepID=UPI00226E0ABE|nr:hypothetical protein [Corallococcus sp. bb12-1]MCY1040514.1 hypothetical protein [Corallococcus sp. bb12-1]
MFDVHIGFMDEEVKPVLNQLLKLNESPPATFESVMHRLFLVNRDRPIYVIERDDILNGSSLFQMIEHQYSLPWDYKVVAVLPETREQELPALKVARRGKDDKGLEFASLIAKKLSKAAQDSDFAAQVTALWNSGNKTKLAFKGSMAYTVYAFNCKSSAVDHRNPVVIVRAPEMGLQPELIRLNLKTIMLALGQIKLPGNKSDRSAANVYMYGAGGAMGSGTKPGKLQHIMGSVYIGAEVDSESLVGKVAVGATRKERTVSLGQRWVGLVAFSCPDSHIVLYRSASQGTHKEALDLAKAEFKSLRLMAPLKQCQKLVDKLYPSYSISLTASDFIGGDIKAAARDQGLGGDCNMEDYHVLRILHEMRFGVGMPQLFNHGLARIDCDPPHIPQALFTTFKTWAQEARWTKAHYIEGILWGLRGITAASVSWDHAHWGFKDRVAALNLGSLDKYFYLVGDRVLCPFFTELACDLLETAATATSSSAVFGFPNAAVAKFSTLQYRAKMIQALGVALIGQPEKLAGLRSAIGAFIDTFGEILEDAGLKERNVDVWPIWARPGWGGDKWKEAGSWAVVHVTNVGTAQAMASVWDEHFPVTNAPNGNLDRALYKSTNMMALQVLAPSGGAKVVRDHAWSNVMSELTSKHETQWKPRIAAKDWKAVDASFEAQRTSLGDQLRQERLAYLEDLAGVMALIQRLRASNSCKPPSPFMNDGPPPPPPSGTMVMAF